MKKTAMISILFLAAWGWMGCGGGSTAETDADAPASEAAAPQDPNRGTAEAMINDKKIVIDYGRPPLGGRDRMSEVTQGMVWRLGMNEATNIDTQGALTFGSVEVPAGKYGLFAKNIGPNDWKLLFNSVAEQWGAFNHDPSKDVAEIPLTYSSMEDSTERLTISLAATQGAGGEITIVWGTHKLSVPFEVH